MLPYPLLACNKEYGSLKSGKDYLLPWEKEKSIMDMQLVDLAFSTDPSVISG